jgi:hypothetical protein
VEKFSTSVVFMPLEKLTPMRAHMKTPPSAPSKEYKIEIGRFFVNLI